MRKKHILFCLVLLFSSLSEAETPDSKPTTANFNIKIGADPEAGTETFFYLFSFDGVKKEGKMLSLETFKGLDLLYKMDASKILWLPESKQWRLSDVVVHRFLENGEETLTHLGTLDTTLLVKPEDLFIKEYRAEKMSLEELKAAIELEKTRGSDLAAELQKEVDRRRSKKTKTKNLAVTVVLLISGIAIAILLQVRRRRKLRQKS